MADNTAAARPAKLEDQIREACRVRHYSLATERSYVRWYKQFVRWAGIKHPSSKRPPKGPLTREIRWGG